MGNLFVMVAVGYAVALFVQMLCYAQSVKKGKTNNEREALEDGLMTPQNV